MLVALFGLSCVIAARENLTVREDSLAENYGTRIWPSVRAIRSRPASAVIFSHHWAVMEMAAVVRGRAVVTVDDRPQLDRAVAEALLHEPEVLLVDGPGRRRLVSEGLGRHGDVRVRWSSISSLGQYRVLLGRLDGGEP